LCRYSGSGGLLCFYQLLTNNPTNNNTTNTNTLAMNENNTHFPTTMTSQLQRQQLLTDQKQEWKFKSKSNSEQQQVNKKTTKKTNCHCTEWQLHKQTKTTKGKCNNSVVATKTITNSNLKTNNNQEQVSKEQNQQLQ